jgi:rubrerythrin
MLFPSVETAMQRFFLKNLLSTARGRAYALSQAAIAESTDEGAVFGRLAAKLDDPELQKMVRKHSDDETRHAALFFECADRQGVGRPHVPADTQVLERLNARLPFYNRAIETREDVMVAYLLLQVIEERAIEQFALIEPLLRVHDPVSADVIAGIAKDEERHLRYCHAIVKRYAPSEEVRVAKLRELREAESLSYQEHQKHGLAHLLNNGYLSFPQQLLWRTVSRVTSSSRKAPRTRFYSTYGSTFATAA